MNLAIEILVYGGIIPAAIATATMLLLGRLLPEDAAERYAAALALAAAFFAGYALLPSWAPLVVSRNWQWLPYLGAVAAVTGPVALAAGVARLERWLLQLLLALLAAWLLVPDWPDLEPSRPVYIALLAGYLLLLAALLEPLALRVAAAPLTMLLCVTAGAAAIGLAVFVSIKFGQVAGVAAAALAGCSAASFWDRREAVWRGLVPTYVIIVGGVVFVGYVTPEPPLTALLLIPAAPLALWACVRGPLARLSGFASLAVRVSLVLVSLLLALILAWAGTFA